MIKKYVYITICIQQFTHFYISDLSVVEYVVKYTIYTWTDMYYLKLN